MVIVLYMMEISPPCRAVLMTVKYMGLKVELREENLIIGNSKKHPELLKINPRSCVPTIDDDGFYLWESRAIMTYLVNKYAPSSSVYPKDPKKRAMVDMMLSFDQGTLYHSQVEYLYPLIFRGEPPDARKEASYRNSLLILDRSLEKNAYAAGKHLTLADLSIVASIALAEMNPQHTVPTIDDNGFYLWESRVIQMYLVNKYAPDNPVYPTDAQERAVVDRMLYFDMGTLYKAEFEYLYPQLAKGLPSDEELEEPFKKALNLFEEFLGKTDYAAGDHITIADLSILASLTFAEIVDYSFAAYPKITAWLQKLKSEAPSYEEINEIPLKNFKEFWKSKE